MANPNYFAFPGASQPGGSPYHAPTGLPAWGGGPPPNSAPGYMTPYGTPNQIPQSPWSPLPGSVAPLPAGYPVFQQPAFYPTTPQPPSPYAHPYPVSPGGFGGGLSPLPLRRSVSNSGYGSPGLYRSKSAGSAGYSARDLARRPRDWREDYSPRGGLGSYLPRIGRPRSDVKEWTDTIRRTLSALLLYSPSFTHTSSPPIIYDIRNPPLFPSSLSFPKLGRAANELDLAQVILSPPAVIMRLFHERFPWYIDIEATHDNGVTLYDLLTQMFEQLNTQISERHYWNEEMGEQERMRIDEAFRRRVDGREEEVRVGVKRVDFLGDLVIFEGLARGRGGMWEMKLAQRM